jgi:hypothetical protein
VLIAAEDRYTPTADHPEHTPAEACVWRFWRHRSGVSGPEMHHLKGPWPQLPHSEARAAAYVNHGRWCVDCPFPGCSSSQYASRGDHRFFCVDCGSEGRWVFVTWPADDEVAVIEALLELRPIAETRNWRPGEPVAALAAENEAQGLR